MPTTLLIALSLTSCKKTPEEEPEPSVIMDVEQTATMAVPGLTANVEVLYNAYGVPTIFGENDADVARVHGYLIARDRFFFIDLTRRLGLGTVSELVGQDGLEIDIESRQRGAAHVLALMEEELERAPRQATYIDGYAAGINLYIEQAIAGDVPPPKEVELLAPMLGIETSVALQPFSRRDVLAGLAYTVFELAWEPGDVGRARDLDRFATLFDGAPLEDLRKAGMRADVFDRVIPPVDAFSAPDWAPGGDEPTSQALGTPRRPSAPLEMLDRLNERLHSAATRLGKDREAGFGSNAWAVQGAHSSSGSALLASDPHLPLSIPSYGWLVGIDTQELGGGELHAFGWQVTPTPFIGIGTNGDFAWGQTNAGGGDITDWYVEQITLDANGAPASSLFQGAQQPLTVTVDTYEVASVPLLGSAGGTMEIPRYSTFDGRWITSIEGREVDGPDDVNTGETAINLMGDWIVPEDLDGVDGITAVSFDYTGFDMRATVRAVEEMTRARSVDEFVGVSQDMVAYGLQFIGADSSGSILFTPYMAMPCRNNLPRNPDGSFVEGADPRFLIDGTQYGGFEVPSLEDGRVDFSQTDDPSKCLVSWADQAYTLDPMQGYVASANADPGGYSLDNVLTNDGPYIGGPWLEGYRLNEISLQLESLVGRGDVTVEDMRVLQSNHTSVIGKQLAPVLLDAIDAAAAASDVAGAAGATARLAALYDGSPARFDEVAQRIADWRDRGYAAESGVQTFYAAPTAEQQQDAVATMIFNAWMGRFQELALGDEGMPMGDHGRLGTMRMLLESRGNPSAAASHNPDTDESVYWDILSTPEVETSEEIAMLALVDALDFLEGPSTGPGEGGFETTDMDQWLWGLRHWVDMEPLLLDLLGDDLAFLVEDFVIDSAKLPLEPGLAPTDPRADVPGFPRHSDHKNVDAANSGTNGVRFDNSYGAVLRFVVELQPDGARGLAMMPGGQSADPTSPHFSDQAEGWLANEAMPFSTVPAEVAAMAVGRETFTP